jgi:hypothetical protein
VNQNILESFWRLRRFVYNQRTLGRPIALSNS